MLDELANALYYFKKYPEGIIKFKEKASIIKK